ncbi:Glycyl-tRNA synthetase beta chain [hydrothermal vent metagenome]|uniref:glycine--tRNA ligase n=1 Tax=hydrothermal vent metagenome TaxID=652676 RepID=A0A1W1BM53_9ZZZZ
MTEALLIEIGVEELPAIPLLKILSSIEKSWAKILTDYQLSCEFEFLYTPRRLVLKHKAIAREQADAIVEFFGPPLMVGIKDGVATKAGEGFARKCGVHFDDLGRGDKNGKEVLYYKKEEKGAKTTALLEEMLKKWLSLMAFGKTMRWGNGSDEFVRPLRWLQVRMGDTIVPVSLFGIVSSDETYVHRMFSYDPIAIVNISEHEAILAEGAVMLRPLELEHGIMIERDKALIAEVVAITENPKALLGSFDIDFLALPPEVIITSMKEHQRYFPVFEKGKLSNKFVVVSNAYTNDYSKVIAGNERVLKPRLADGLFFYHNDLKAGLSNKGLEKVQFIDGLGTLADKIERERSIALTLLGLYCDKVEVETSKEILLLETLMDRAISLAKADLMSEMVYEFTELQGLMGYYYAKALKEEKEVYMAIKEQYMPIGEGAELPSSIFSSILAMSVKVDTLFGLFSVGRIPTGSKDPFALRRAVNGIIRMIIAHDLAFNIDDMMLLLQGAYEEFDTKALGAFIIERMYKSLDANPSVIASVLASGERDINEITKKVEALNTIVCADTFKEQFSTFKRVANISKDVDLSKTLSIDITLFKEEEEGRLYRAYMLVIEKEYANYQTHFDALFGLKEVLDVYFDTVMVNSKEPLLKENRLNMIASIYKTFKNIADIKEISV